MPGPPLVFTGPQALDARTLLLCLQRMVLDRFDIVGSYLRSDGRTRVTLKDLRQPVIGAYERQSRKPPIHPACWASRLRTSRAPCEVYSG